MIWHIEDRIPLVDGNLDMEELKIILMGTTITMDKTTGLEEEARVVVSEDDKFLCNHNFMSTSTEPILIAQSLSTPDMRNILLMMSKTMLIMRNLMNIRLPMMYEKYQQGQRIGQMLMK